MIILFIGIAALEVAPKAKYSSAACAICHDQNSLVDLAVSLSVRHCARCSAAPRMGSSGYMDLTWGLIRKFQKLEDVFGDADGVAVLVYDLDFCDGFTGFFVY